MRLLIATVRVYYVAVLAAFAILAGGSTGSMMSLTSPLVAESVTMRQMPQAVTMTYSCLVFGVISGAPLAGVLFDCTGTMTAPFIFAGSAIILAAIILNSPFGRLEKPAQEP